jgi:hypothetical protein
LCEGNGKELHYFESITILTIEAYCFDKWFKANFVRAIILELGL